MAKETTKGGIPDWNKKYDDLVDLGIASTYWKEILDVIKYFSSIDDFEKCQVLYDYYQKHKH